MPHIIWDFDWAPLNYIFQGEHNQILYVELQFEGRYKILFIHKFLYRYVFAHFVRHKFNFLKLISGTFVLGNVITTVAFFTVSPLEFIGIYTPLYRLLNRSVRI